jgi:hypothetical protein
MGSESQRGGIEREGWVPWSCSNMVRKAEQEGQGLWTACYRCLRKGAHKVDDTLNSPDSRTFAGENTPKSPLSLKSSERAQTGLVSRSREAGLDDKEGAFRRVE